jgi:uncharacterized protein with NAD-binding domain and iron-sulfur cluster
LKKKKIAILGGGVGSLVTAYYLTRTPELRAKHDVTLYQMGWRLGGKGASGRSLVPDEHLRIEEHGLHLWFGFYENAFRTIQEVYARKPARADDRLVTWRDGFRPCSFTPIADQDGAPPPGELGYWPVMWPTNTDVPGDGRLFLTPSGAIAELLSVLHELLALLPGTLHGEGLRGRAENAILLVEITALLGALGALGDLTDTPLGDLIARFVPVRALITNLRERVQKHADTHLSDVDFRRIYSVFDIAASMLVGLVDPRWGIIQSDLEFDLDVVDDLEFRDWLIANGCDEWVARKSSYLRALYDLPFAYDEGDIQKPGLGAGTAVRILLRIVFTYKEACFFEMQAGMGEVVVAPIYEVLREQGVRFEFFRKVKRLELSPTGRWVQRVHIDRQVDTRGVYEPTFRVAGVTCWPSEPFYDQIVDGAAIKAKLDAKKSSLESNWCDVPPAGSEVLELGVDFDQIVLGIALPAFKPLNDVDRSMVDELIAASPRFAAMVKGLAIVPTQSFQIWTKDDLAGLGWRAMRSDPPAMNAAPEPYSVWADCSHVLPKEQWPRANAPKGVFYYCGPWKNELTSRPTSDASVPAKARADVEARAIEWLTKYAGSMFPNAASPTNPASLDFDRLYDPRNEVGTARMGFQWIRPNVDPTECVEASLPGSSKVRLKADESGVDNLFMAGAWLRTGINATCVEAAVMSGMDCARAVSGEPLEIVGEWFGMRRGKR